MKSKSTIQTKIFIGYEITVDLKFHLNQHKNWKQASVANLLGKEGLKKLPFNGKEYIGLLFEYEMISLKEVNEQAEKVKETIQQFCDDIDWSKRQIQIFPQVFIT